MVLAKFSTAPAADASCLYTRVRGNIVQLARSEHELFKLLIRLLEIIIDNNHIMNARHVRVPELDLGLSQPLLDILLGLGAATPYSSLKHLEARRLDKNIARIDAGRRLHRLDALHLDIQHDHQPFCRPVSNGLFARAVVVAAEKRMFHRVTLGDEVARI